MSKKQTLTLISWNVNGIRSIHRKGLFVPFVEKYQPDIFCLQETKAEQSQSEVDLPDYEEYWNSSRGRKGYSGTAIFTKTKPLAVINDFPPTVAKRHGLMNDGYGDPNAEGRVIAAEYDRFYVVSVYTPNAKPDLSRLPLRHKHWDPAFLDYVKRLEKKKPVIFCGDLNVAHTEIDLANPKQNEGEHGFTREEREGADRIVAAGFVDTFRLFTKEGGHYSWWTHFAKARSRNIGWRIDYVFVSAALKKSIKEAFILEKEMGSDHAPVGIRFEI